MEEIFCMEWNMEEIFRYGMEDGMEKNCRYGIWKNRLPFHSITCPGQGGWNWKVGVGGDCMGSGGCSWFEITLKVL